MEKYHVDFLVIGGGISGLSLAKKISLKNKEVFLIEKNLKLGQEASSRNSEVIHAGIYYPEDSLKAKLCVEGKFLLYEYLEKNNIAYRKCGKYILANSDEESERLEDLYNNALDCGVLDLSFNDKGILDYKFLKYERSLFSPSNGIFDSHSYMVSLSDEIKENGGTILTNNKFRSINITKNYFEIIVHDLNHDEEFIVKTKKVFNCAGLESANIANLFYNQEKFLLTPVKGDYYSYIGKEKLNHLIYPMPNKNSLGTHATLDLGQGIRFGPSAYAIDDIEYSINEEIKKNFYSSIRKYWPGIKKEELTPNYSGIRAIINEEQDFLLDFALFDENYLVNILSYVSPGLTSSLALADHIYRKCEEL